MCFHSQSSCWTQVCTTLMWRTSHLQSDSYAWTEASMMEEICQKTCSGSVSHNLLFLLFIIICFLQRILLLVLYKFIFMYFLNLFYFFIITLGFIIIFIYLCFSFSGLIILYMYVFLITRNFIFSFNLIYFIIWTLDYWPTMDKFKSLFSHFFLLLFVLFLSCASSNEIFHFPHIFKL